MRCLPIFLFFVLAVSTLATAKNQESRPISLLRKNLTPLRNSKVTKGLGKAFHLLVERYSDCQKCAEPFESAFQYLQLFNKDFMVVEIEPNNLGGYFVLVVFKRHNKTFRLWLKEIDKGEYQVREMTPLRVTLNKRMMDEFSLNDYEPFWVAPGAP